MSKRTVKKGITPEATTCSITLIGLNKFTMDEIQIAFLSRDTRQEPVLITVIKDLQEIMDTGNEVSLIKLVDNTLSYMIQ